MRLYISGPMTGLPGYNLQAFADATAALDAVGYEAVNPGEAGVIEGYTWQDYMRAAIALLVTCDAVACLPGWEGSDGARLEVHVADHLGMPVDDLSEWLHPRV